MNTTTNPEVIPANIAITAPNPEILRRGASSALDLVQNFEITDAATYGIAAEELQGIKTKRDALNEQRLNLTRPLDGVKAAIMSLFRGPVELLDQAEQILKGKMLTYSREEQRKADEARLLAERAAQEQREKLAREAADLAAQGRTGEAAVKEQVAQMVVAAPIAAPAPPVAKGISTRETIEFEVVDLLDLVKHVAANPDKIGLLAVDSTKLRAYVRGLGMATNLPGVRVFPKQTLAARKG